ncbi:MAG: DUF87 domain-containing protein [Firmicutes bacterium]|nr:DUF87 domain-containing protein [Bacillota bacterium]
MLDDSLSYPRLVDLYLPDRITELEDCVVIDDTYCRVLVVDAIPEFIHFGWFDSISSYPGVTISVALYPYTHEEASNRVGKLQMVLGGELILAEKNQDTRRMDVLQEKYYFYRELLKDINLHRNNIIAASVVILIAAPTHDELVRRTSKVKDILGSTRATTMYLRQIEGLRSALPFIKPSSEYHDVTVANAACLSPLISTDFSHPSGIFFGRNETGSPVFLDLFIGQPRLFGNNMLIVGMTRSGKSYACKGTIARSVASDKRAVILDPEGEYRNLCEYLGGTHIRFYPEMKPMFNPFDMVPSWDRERGEYVDIPTKIDDIVSLVAFIFESYGSNENMTVEERALAGQAVRLEYERLGINENPESLFRHDEVLSGEGITAGKSHKEMPTISSYVEMLRKLKMDRLVNVMQPFLRGGPQGFFDGQSDRSFGDSPVVGFDISSIENETTKTYIMYVMLSWVWEHFVKKNRHVQKIALVDEAWLFMKQKDTANFLSQTARRGAKYNNSLIVASQSFREFTSEEGIVLMNQCDTKFFLKLQQSDAEALGALFGLTENLVERLQNFQRGQGFLKAGSESAVVYFSGMPFEEHFLRSDPEAVLSR